MEKASLIGLHYNQAGLGWLHVVKLSTSGSGSFVLPNRSRPHRHPIFTRGSVPCGPRVRWASEWVARDCSNQSVCGLRPPQPYSRASGPRPGLRQGPAYPKPLGHWDRLRNPKGRREKRRGLSGPGWDRGGTEPGTLLVTVWPVLFPSRSAAPLVPL